MYREPLNELIFKVGKIILSFTFELLSLPHQKWIDFGPPSKSIFAVIYVLSFSFSLCIPFSVPAAIIWFVGHHKFYWKRIS